MDICLVLVNMFCVMAVVANEPNIDSHKMMNSFRVTLYKTRAKTPIAIKCKHADIIIYKLYLLYINLLYVTIYIYMLWQISWHVETLVL